MGLIQKGLAALCAILFSITAVVALIFFNFDRKGFSAETYQQVFANDGFYNRLPRVLAETINASSFNENDLPLVMRGMGLQAWEAFFRAMLPQPTLNAMGKDALNSTFAYLNLETNSAEISLLPLKESMTSSAGVDAVYALLNTQPDCTLVQVGQMTINLLTVQDIQFCKPPEKLHPVLTPVIQAQMQVAAIVMPDKVTLASAEGVPPENDPRIGLQNLRVMMRLTPLIPLGLLLLLSVIAVNSIRSWLDWWGVPFLITGFVAIIISISGSPVIGELLRRMIAQRAPDYLPVAFSDYASDLAAAMVKALIKPILWQGLILALIGIVLITLSYLVRQRQNKIPPSEMKTVIE